MTDGFDVFVQDVMDAMTTAPCGRSYVTRPSRTGDVFVREPRGEERERFLEGEEGGAESAGSAAAVGAGAEGCIAVPRAVMPPSPPSLSHFPITFGSTFAHSFSRKFFRLSLKIFFESLSGTRS